MSGTYRFSGPLYSLLVSPRGGGSGESVRGTSTEPSRGHLQLMFARGANAGELGRLLDDLGFPPMADGQLDTGHRLRIERELLDRIRARFDFLRIDRRSMVVPLDGDDDEVLGPAPAAPTTHWIGVQLLDKNTGQPLPRRPYSIGDELGFDSTGKLGADGTVRVNDLTDASDRSVQVPAYPAVIEQDRKVLQGEHASGIAELFGFENVHDIWDDPSNADLAKLRKPHVLFPGDVLHIPARPETTTVKKPVDQFHIFQIDRSPLKLLVELHDNFKHALSGLDVSFLAQTTPTDGTGLYTTDVEKSQRGGTLSLPARDLNLCIGHLDPIEEDTGWRARLVNLGFMWDDDGGPAEDHIAIEDFQADQSLPISGELDDATRGKILTVHGC